MKKFPIDPRLLEKAEQIIKGKCTEMDERVADLGREIMEDQKTWLDAQMKDILTPELYQKGRCGEGESEIAEYVRKNGIRIIFIPDSVTIRIEVRGRPHSEFTPRLLVDGQPVPMKREGPALDQN